MPNRRCRPNHPKVRSITQRHGSTAKPRCSAWRGTIEMAQKGYITYTLAGVIRETYALPDRIIDAMTKPGDASGVPRRLRRILTAMTAEPNSSAFA